MIACLYDVHGNLAALEAVLDDARGAGADEWILGGDYALFGGWPAETVARLRTLSPALWIRGNGERWTASPGDAPEDSVVQGAIAASRE
ncbi:MAG TPA: metallophosphoesterase, partial [Solirubrobacteraceae bacterium]